MKKPKAINRGEIVTPTHDSRGKFAKGNRLGASPGRPLGSKDTRPRRGSIRAVYEDFIEAVSDGRNGHDMMVEAVRLGIQSGPKTAHKYLEVGARVLDGADDTGGKRVYFTLITNVNFEKLRGAQQTIALPPPGERTGGAHD